MEKKEKEIKKANLEATIASLQEDKAVVLLSINSELEKAEHAKKQREKANKEEEAIRSLIKLRQQELGRIDQKIATFKRNENKYKQSVWKSKEEEKTQNKKLARLNKLILTAEDEIKELDIKVAEIKITITEKEKLADGILPLKNEVERLENEKQQVQFKTDEIQRLTKSGLAKMKLEVQDLEKRKDKAEEEMKTAKEERNALNSFIEIKKKDIDVVVTRIEEHYDKAFPDLRLNI